MRRLILVGGGHAHLSVLQAVRNQRPDIEAVLITPGTHQTYSGMLPGWMAGHYSLSDCQVDLRPLAHAADVRLISGQVTGMDARRRQITVSDGSRLEYDLLSLDVGSESNLSWLEESGSKLLPVKPIAQFVRRWPMIIAEAKKDRGYHLVVVGGGAAGVEIAFVAQHVFAEIGCNARVSLIASDKGVLTGHAPGVSRRIRQLLEQRGITLYEQHAAGDGDGVLLADGRHVHADIVIAATGSTPPAWLRDSQLALDEHGYVSVDAMHRSLSHPAVFAAGDVCARTDTHMARSGVHAVFAGPVVAHNLIASIAGGKFIHYRPRKRSLYLLATGPKHAVASWGRFSASGYWVWRWKNWIDRRFMSKHSAGALRHE